MNCIREKSLEAETLVQDGLDKVAQVAKFLNISKSAVYTLMTRGELPFAILGKKSRRVPHRAVIALAARSLVPTHPCDAADVAPTV